MNRYEEVICDLDGKIAYANATGNIQAKKEWVDIQNAVKQRMKLREKEPLDEIQRDESSGQD